MSTNKTYWRSLGQLVDDPSSRAFLDREFPEGASEPPEGVSRRTMLQLMGASLSLAGLTACRRPVEPIVPYVTAPEEILPGVPLHYATTMPFGRTSYGVVVESHEGRPTKIEGNDLHPSCRGASSSWIQASILDLYDPDRSRSPREGETARSWEDFDAAWAALGESPAQNGGAGLAVIGEEFASPSMERAVRAFRERFPRARFATWGPLSDEHVQQGMATALGAEHERVHHFDKASVVLSLDADFLLTDPESVRHARGFADGRRIRGERGTMSRLWVVESAHTLTGGNADQRLRLRPGRVAGLLGMLAAELRNQGLNVNLPAASPPGVRGVEADWIHSLAEDLVANRGAGIVIAGRSQPPAVHAATQILNAALGNLGRTITLHEPAPSGRSDTAELGRLVGSMREGKVRALVILGGNPVYDAPADFEFAEALAEVETSVHLSSHVNETSLACRWQLPQAHFLESWGDARAAGGTLSVVQPLIRPLFGGRSNLELLGRMAIGPEFSAYDYVRETWQGIVGESAFEARWDKTLFDGLLEGSDASNSGAVPVPGPDRERQAFSELAKSVADVPDDALDVIFRPSASLYDGRFANNGWLQELPDPITKITWDNAALVSPATAAALDVKHEDMVRVSYEGRELELPAWLVPGQADGTIVIELGHGRTAAGRVGSGHGFDAYLLRTSTAPGFDSWVMLEKTGATHKMAETQHHDEMDELGEQAEQQRVPSLIREATLADFLEHPDFVEEYEIEHPPLESLWHEHSYENGQQWGMTIDLNACTGCGTCVIACQSENNIPVVGKQQVADGREMHWIRIDRYFSGAPEAPEAVFQPVPCMHCENAPCEQVCPVAATVHDAEGLNTMVYNRCIGTRYCANNCPYKVRRFNFFNFTKDTPEVQKLANNPDVTVRSRGVMEKCSYCVQRINRTRIDAKLAGRPLRDGEIRTACEQACPSRAIRFGDIRDDASGVAKDKADPRNYALLAEMNNKPRTSYMGKLRNPHPDLEEA